MYTPKCDDCGKFFKGKHSYALMFDFSGPDYEHLRCGKCTERKGPVQTNVPNKKVKKQYQGMR